ncbi:M24 family metallopeptidase [Sediminibacillus massiliensis]|uniref:M24 family metallopeptidase n=1 Tax=Sediminibacillus massiliensis TaxID=1926277 RepID=UPI0009886243|nr:aminopeptidase P family protein [Sediminibacillus massiliensis]
MSILKRIRKRLEEDHLDGIMITNGYNRRYVSHFTGSSGILLITASKAMLLTDFRYVDQATNQATQFEVINGGRDLTKELAKQTKELNIKRLGFESIDISFDSYSSYKKVIASELIPLKGFIQQFRMIKTTEEMKKIKTAVDITDQAFIHILNFIQPGKSEIEVANELERKMRELGAKSSAFDMIIASGYRASLPHGLASNKKIEEGDLVTMDFGAYYDDYRADMTRTIAVGSISEKWKEIYHIVHEALARQTQGIKAGLSAKEADSLSRDYITSQGYGEFYGHGSGHGIGLEIHENPFMSTRSTDTLEADMVITIEPGIYLPNEAGVRIEDDVLVTDEGCEILTGSTKDMIVL